MHPFITVLALCLLVAAPPATAQEKKETTGGKQAAKEKSPAKQPARPAARKPKAPVLDLALVARRSIWCDRSPRFLGWSADGKTVYFSHAPAEESAPSPVFAHDVKTGKTRKLAPREVWALPPTLYPSLGSARRDRGRYPRRQLSPDHKLQAFTRNGDVFLLEIASGTEQRLTTTKESESDALFSGDGKRVFFRRAGALFAMNLGDHLVTQLTDIRPGPKPKAKKPEDGAKTDLQKALFEQQKSLFEWVKELRRRREAREKRDKEREKFDRKAVRTFYTPDGAAATVAGVSPDGRFVVLRLSKSKGAAAGKRTVVPTYVTESGFVETASSRTKVGEPLSADRWGVLDLKTNKMKPIDPEPLRDTRPSYVGFEWSPDGKRLAALALAENWRTRWVLAIDPATARTEVVDALHDPAWIGGPAWSRFGWLKDSERIWFTSEATGYSHLYVAHRTGRFRRQLTRGAFEVHNVRLSWDRERFLLITNERHPGERHLYVMDTEGGSPRLLTAAFAGIDDAAFGPDPKQLVVVHSTPTMPVSLSLLEVGAGNREPRVLRRIFRGATDSYLAGKWIAPRVVHFPDKHGNRVYARLYVPEKPHPLKPAVIHAHGAGYAQYAHRRWQSRPHTYLFSQYLLKKGYHVLDIDYRGSSGYGRDCRTEIYRYMGGSEIDSGEAAVDFLARACGVDPKRVGLFGGSYGGFYTLMALFTRPGLFRAGVALYPVTDWSHYNHWYTARILNLPQEDREAYHRSSPIYLARNLKDRLQIQHGVVDSNVHFQDTLRLVQRLIELKKTGWDVAVYPVEGHGWRTEASRLDSCRRMVGLFDEVLLAPGLD